MAELSCPGCGASVSIEPGSRDAGGFCPSCDYPLFWAAPPRVEAVDAEARAGLRRLPGTAGRVTVGTLTCWRCHELNSLTATLCGRCGADLAGPPPEPVPEPPPPPVVAPPPPPPPPPSRWPVIVAAVVIVLLLLAVIVVAS